MKTIIAILIATIALVSCGEKKQADNKPQTPANQKYSISDRSLNESGPRYKITGKYPVTGNADLDSIVSRFVANTVTEFKDDIKADTQSHPWMNDLTITYNASITRYKYVSYELDSYRFTGGAHGMTLIQTFNYDLSSNKLLSLPDLFALPTYLDTLSLLSFAYLKQALDTNANVEMIESGTQPLAETFERFQLIPMGLQIHFGAYEVAPYVYGPQQVTIPYARLKGLLKPEVLEMPVAE
jgi:hypothetical protein